ncbi:hypothetical protein MAR_018642 [Mya arenaria]|uniref:DNA-directed DNA polymerase n=1 Tax=Mya arenaria TaxID=6604 RepID=A0ABY7EHQ1_MYAAR|nr:hypothetical protein MAR_018642 [Mya arenaria]
MFNRKENQQVILQHLPDLHYYNVDSMNPEAKQKFLMWYEENKNELFDFQTELLRYCQSDVDILRKCCLKFRKMFMELTKKGVGNIGIDPFENCITIASACNLVYRTNFLEHEMEKNPDIKQYIQSLEFVSPLEPRDAFFEKQTCGLFTDYVNTFLKMKKACGWPDWCVDEETKQRYIQQYYKKEVILLDYNTIVKHPGLRSLAKRM